MDCSGSVRFARRARLPLESRRPRGVEVRDHLSPSQSSTGTPTYGSPVVGGSRFANDATGPQFPRIGTGSARPFWPCKPPDSGGRAGGEI